RRIAVFAMSYTDLTEAAVRAELERIIAGPAFEDSERLVRFLTFIVDQTLTGNPSGLKESVIGMAVFGRPAGYDPKTDPIVRVQARRLRAKLESWYLDAGRESAIRIELPKGGYVPEFTWAPSPKETAQPAPASEGLPVRRPRSIVWALAALVPVVV